MEITKLTILDIDIIHNLLLEQFGDEAWSKNMIESSLKSNSTQFFGILKGDVLVCVASILVSVDDINLLDIATKNEFKRRGYAKKMMGFLISLKKDNQTFSLEVKSTNTNAISLYEKLGFKTVSIRKRYYKDSSDALCMFLV